MSSAGEESELAVAALQAGAVELVHKPTALATDRLYELGAELVAKVRVAAGEPRCAPPRAGADAGGAARAADAGPRVRAAAGRGGHVHGRPAGADAG